MTINQAFKLVFLLGKDREGTNLTFDNGSGKYILTGPRYSPDNMEDQDWKKLMKRAASRVISGKYID